MLQLKTVGLFALTAVAEILGCYLPFLWLRKGQSVLLLAPAVLCLALFAWLLTLHADSAGRVYAAYGGVYVVTAIFWLWRVEGQPPTTWDMVGSVITLIGMSVIAFQPVSRSF